MNYDEWESRPVRVGVLVDLKLRPSAGGHVKCWEQFARAATRVPDAVDVTVHFEGDKDQERVLAQNVRYRIFRPALSSGVLPLPVRQPDHSDLAPVHLRLQRFFEDYDVLHATDAWFAYARTAMRYHLRHGTPLVSSTHTDVPSYTRVVTRRLVQRLFGRRMRRLLLSRVKVHWRMGRAMQRRLERYLAECDHVLASSEADARLARRVLSEERVTRLRRGIDKEFFHPRRRDRARVEERYGLPAGRLLLLCVGRLDEAKQPMVLARAAQLLAGQGLPVHAVFVGRGPLGRVIEKHLGSAATVIDPLPHEELRDVYASADLFVFPSATEVLPNVVIEAKACGLPVVLSRHGGSQQLVQTPGEDGLLLESGRPAEWAAAIERLWRNEDLRQSMAVAARRHIETNWPSWDDVFREDLLPAWERVARPALRLAAAQRAARSVGPRLN